MSLVSRIKCPNCSAECMEQENNCWQCGKPLRVAAPAPESEPQNVLPAEPQETATPRRGLFNRRTREPEKRPVSVDDVLTLDSSFTSFEPVNTAPDPEPADEQIPTTRTMTTLTGEVVEVEAPAESGAAATIGESAIQAKPEEPVFIQTYCSNCGFQNEEGVRECKKCGHKLAILSEPPRDIEPLPRAWGFDVLGAAWILLGLAAIYSGIFLIRADHRAGTTPSDYFWTLIVAAAPGVFIFMRHVFCKLLFYVMALGSVMIWLVIGFIWLYVGLQLTPNGQIGLTWFAVFSVLSIVSWFTVRVNDAFDYSF